MLSCPIRAIARSRFGSLEEEESPQEPKDWNVTIIVPPKASVRIENAFIEAPDREDTFFAEVLVLGRRATILRIQETDDPVPVDIP
jgi:hypothetical protein